MVWESCPAIGHGRTGWAGSPFPWPYLPRALLMSWVRAPLPVPSRCCTFAFCARCLHRVAQGIGAWCGRSGGSGISNVAVRAMGARELDKLLLNARAFNSERAGQRGLAAPSWSVPAVFRGSAGGGGCRLLAHQAIASARSACRAVESADYRARVCRVAHDFAEAPRSALEQISNEVWASGVRAWRNRQELA